MLNENQEGIELVLILHEKLRAKNPEHTLLSLVEIDKKTIRKKEGFDKAYCRENDGSCLPSLVRYSLDLLKAREEEIRPLTREPLQFIKQYNPLTYPI